ncbi:MAG: response regulator transcription factor [Lachnospiraceae bacterium]|nr:response regulator transcription factor [Lachnospiraceae bacterium]
MAERSRILIVDDEARMRHLVRDYLVRQDYDIVEAADGDTALRIFFSDKQIALVILDIMMPGIDGLAVASRIRQSSSVPIIILTARGTEQDELKGFEIGVDEYIAKPFSPRILVARVEAILRRLATHESGAPFVLEGGGIILDKAAHVVNCGERSVHLSYKEFELLSFFMENQGMALSREKILDRVWNYDYFGDARTIDTHVKKLRNKLGPEGSAIRTVWGIGYKFEG